jgi:hypothetical protein
MCQLVVSHVVLSRVVQVEVDTVVEVSVEHGRCCCPWFDII